jgi:hypothetical protein
MSFPLKLDRFAETATTSNTVFISADRLAQLKRDAFLAGEKAGFQKSQTDLKNQGTEATNILSQKLQDISFTHFEARKAVLDSLEMLISQLVKAVLPGIASDALVDVVAAQVLAVAGLLTDGPIRIYCAPSNVSALNDKLETMAELPVAAKAFADPDCTDNCVRIIAPECERFIDIDQVLGGIREGISEFYNPSTEEKRYG